MITYPTQNSTSLPNDLISELVTDHDAVVTTNCEELSIPWDADFSEIDDGRWAIHGSVGPSGFGSCACYIGVDTNVSEGKPVVFVTVHNANSKVLKGLIEAGWEILGCD